MCNTRILYTGRGGGGVRRGSHALFHNKRGSEMTFVNIVYDFILYMENIPLNSRANVPHRTEPTPRRRTFSLSPCIYARQYLRNSHTYCRNSIALLCPYGYHRRRRRIQTAFSHSVSLAGCIRRIAYHWNMLDVGCTCSQNGARRCANIDVETRAVNAAAATIKLKWKLDEFLEGSKKKFRSERDK